MDHVSRMNDIIKKMLNGEELSDEEAAVLKTETQDTQEAVEPMIKQLGGKPDIKPEKAVEMAGEEESPDLEEMDNVINYRDLLEKKKRQMGY